MKKLISLLEVLIMLVSICSCNKIDNKNNNDKTEELIKTATSQQLNEWRALTDKRILDIENTPNMEIPEGSKIYYISNNGNDRNDGLSPETAWASLSMTNSEKLTEGSYLLFERGGTWRGKAILKDGITYSSYGTGEKPLLTASPFNGADPELWAETDAKNVWRLVLGKGASINDIGFILCDGNIASRAIQTSNQDGTIVDHVSGCPLNSYADLCNDLQFLYLEEGSRRTACIYMYSEVNPGIRFSSIEFGVTSNIMYAVTLHNVTIDNLAIAYTGAHGFGIGSSSNISVQNCTFKWIGGGILDYEENGGFVRYGNAVEIYGSCDGFFVDNNYIYQVYDTGITCQFTVGNLFDKTLMNNIKNTNNVIEYCHWSFEYYLHLKPNESTPQFDGTINDLLIENNITWHVGEGLCEQRPRYNSCNFAGGLTTRMRNYIIKDNLFISSQNEIFGGTGTYENNDGAEHLPILINNTFVHDKNLYFGRMTSYDNKWYIQQSYDDSLLDTLASGSYGNKFYTLPNTKDATIPKQANYDIIKFGKYEQDGNLENGPEDIEWYVVDRDGDYILLVSKYILDSCPTPSLHKLWETSDLRNYLNSDFINHAFNNNERSKIKTTAVIMDQNPDYPSNSGNDTYDKLFSLSYSEIIRYFPTEELRMCQATKYANIRGVRILSSTNTAQYTVRTIGKMQEKDIGIDQYGRISISGVMITDNTQRSVRPAMWIKL